MDVTDVLRDRIHEPSGLQWMTGVSIAVHVAVFGAFMMAPGAWLAQQRTDPVNAMTISLGGGGDGPANGGMTPMSARPVQVEAPAPAAREPVRPPAAATPEMTVPTPDARRQRAAASTDVKQAPDQARGRTPTRGAQTSAGNAVAVTGARGEGFGLSSGGGPGVAGTLDVGNFCCPDYLITMVARIKANWNERQNVTGLAVVKLTIRRDGVLEDIELERSSTYPIADLAAQRAVILTKQIPPLPDAFPNPTLTVHLNFQYQR
jgi:TonB family protein